MPFEFSNRALLLLLVLHAVGLSVCDHSIDDYGAVRGIASLAAAQANGIALFNSVQAAAAGANGSRTAVIPRGGEYYVVPHADFEGASNVQLRLEGVLLAYTEGLDSAWPGCNNGRHSCLTVIQFNNCDNVTLQGSGLIDGRGYEWWRHVISNHTDRRPNLLGMDKCTNVVVRGISLWNSPQFHMFLNVCIALFFPSTSRLSF
jgi:polygalacturonase